MMAASFQFLSVQLMRALNYVVDFCVLLICELHTKMWFLMIHSAPLKKVKVDHGSPNPRASQNRRNHTGTGMFSRFHAIDWVGLNNNYLSGRYPLSISDVWSYIDSANPDVVYSIFPPATPGYSQWKSDPAFQSLAIMHTLQGRACELCRYWNTNKLCEMFYREMCYIRDHYEFGGAYNLNWGGEVLIAYIRKDSDLRDSIRNMFQKSRRVDRRLDLANYYVNDPRLLR